MAKEKFYTAIDMGTSKVCTVIARIGDDGDLVVHGMGIVPSDGIHKGRVVDVRMVQEVVRSSVDRAEQDLGRRVTDAYIGVTGDHITCFNTTESIKGRHDGTSVSKREIYELSEGSSPQVPPGKEILHQICIDYVVDGLAGIRSPKGLNASTVEVRSHVIMGDAGPLNNIIDAVNGANIAVRSLVLQPLAAGEAVLTQDEREIGCILVDIGCGTSDLIVYRGGNPWYTEVIPVGGFQLTRDLSVALRGVPHEMAEDLKVKNGHCLPASLSNEDEVIVPSFHGQRQNVISRRDLCQPLYARFVETLELVLTKVHQSGIRESLPGGLILTGGSANMPGLQELATRVANTPVRIASPDGIPGLPQELKDPRYSSGVGVLLWGMKHQGVHRRYASDRRGFLADTGWVRRLANLVWGP